MRTRRHPRQKRALLIVAVMVVLALSVVMLVIGASGRGGGKPDKDGGQSGTSLNSYKIAEGFWERLNEYDWTLTKEAVPSNLEIPPGQGGSVLYTITASRSPGPQTDLFGVRGDMCVTNDGDVTTEGLKIVDRVQFKTGNKPFKDLAGATETIIPSSQLAPGETQCYPYDIAFTPVSGAVYRNVVKVTITNHSGHLGKEFGPEPKAVFSLPTSPVNVEVDKTATLDDVQSIPPGFTAQTTQAFPLLLNGNATIQFTKEISNESAACGQNFILTNTATLVEIDTNQVRQSTANVQIYTGDCPLPPPDGDGDDPGGDGEGCSPGFWKNHLSAWTPTGYSPSDLVGSVFPNANLYALDNTTLLQALKFKGGSTLQGSARTLLRAGVAALLNEAHPSVDYPLIAVAIAVDIALGSQDQSTILALAATLETNNNLGCTV